MNSRKPQPTTKEIDMAAEPTVEELEMMGEILRLTGVETLDQVADVMPAVNSAQSLAEALEMARAFAADRK